MGQGSSSPGSRGRSGSGSSVTGVTALVTGNSGSSPFSSLQKDGTATGLPPLKAKEYLGPDGGFYMPMSAIYPNVPQEWDAETVISLIDRRKLAPFYRALQDELEDNRDPAVTSRQLEIALEGAGATQDSEVTGHHGRAGMRSKEPSAHRKAEVNAYLSGTSECPICMMNFPSNMNTARCCSQPICTECLVYIKRQDPDPNHIEPEAVACPFCVEPDFGVLYEPPPPSTRCDNKGVVLVGTASPGTSSPRTSTSRSSSSDSTTSPVLTVDRPRRKSVPADTPEVVTIDELHPNFHAKVEAMRATLTRRANRRIVFRQVGDRLIPVGITSSRAGRHQTNADASQGSGSSSSISSTLSPRRMRRHRNNGDAQGSSTQDFALAGQDLEEMMINEAIRQSLMEAEADEVRRTSEQQQHTGIQSSTPRNQSASSTRRNSQLVSAMTDTLPIPGPAPGHSPSGSLLPPLNLGNPSLSAQPDAASNRASPPCTSQHSNPEQHQQLEDSESSPAKPHIVQHEETLPVTSVQ